MFPFAVLAQIIPMLQQQLQLLRNLPSQLAAAIAHEIRPLTVDMSDMSDAHMCAARRVHGGIVLSSERMPVLAAARHFPPYNWRPAGCTEDLGEVAASNGSSNEFSPPSSPHASGANALHHTVALHAAAIGAVTSAAVAPTRAAGAASRSVTSSMSTRRPPPPAVSRSLHLAEAPEIAAASARTYVSLLSHLESSVPGDLQTAGVTFADARKQLVLQYETAANAAALGQLVTVKGYTDAAGMQPARDVFFVAA